MDRISSLASTWSKQRGLEGLQGTQLRQGSSRNPAIASPLWTQHSEHKPCTLHKAEQPALSLQVPPSTDRQGHRVTLTYRPLRLPGLMPFLSRKPQLGLTPPQIDSVPPGPCTASLPHGQAQTQAE